MDVTHGAWYSNRVGLYELRLRVRTIENNTAGNYSRYAWTLFALSHTGNGSWTGTSKAWNVNIANQGWAGNAALNFLPDSAGKTIVLGQGETLPIGHGIDGSIYMQINANHGVQDPPGPLPTFGAANVTPRIVQGDTLTRTPAPPGAPVASQITATSMRLDWAPSPNNGGAGLDAYLLRRHTNPNPEIPGYTDLLVPPSTLHAVVTGLNPGTDYYWNVYAHNAVGFSGRSPVTATRTLSGVRVKTGAGHRPAILWVKGNDGVWRKARPFVKTGAGWRPTA